jgi:hypothetical protein
MRSLLLTLSTFISSHSYICKLTMCQYRVSLPRAIFMPCNTVCVERWDGARVMCDQEEAERHNQIIMFVFAFPCKIKSPTVFAHAPQVAVESRPFHFPFPSCRCPDLHTLLMSNSPSPTVLRFDWPCLHTKNRHFPHVIAFNQPTGTLHHRSSL